MPVANRTVVRTLIYVALATVVFAGMLVMLPQPDSSGGTEHNTIPEVSFAVVGVKVFDGVEFLPDQDVWVEDGRIRVVGPNLDLPPDLPRVDGSKRTLLPGLVDAHVHTFGSTLGDAVRFGVTTVLDQFTDPRLVRSQRAARESLGREDQADLFSAGMLATARGGHGTQFGVPVSTIDSPGEALTWVRDRKAEGSDWIKIIVEDGSMFGGELATLSRETVAALISAAHDEGLLAVAHVSRLKHALMAKELGIDGLVHVWIDELIDEDQAAGIAESNLFVVPTLSVMATFGDQSVVSELRKAVGDAPLSPMQRQTLESSFEVSDVDDAVNTNNIAIENVRRLHAAGVRLIAGTDAPNPGTASGLSLHAELHLLMRAGLTVREVLTAATSSGVAVFGIDDRGRIAPGLLADLLLVDGDLEIEIGNSTQVVAIWKDGYPVDRNAGLLPDAVAPAAPDETLIADFENGVASNFGIGWQSTTDQIAGGASTAELSTMDGSLIVDGIIQRGAAYPWAGAIFYPGAGPMQPVDFSDRTALRFRVRGDGRNYVVMLFGATPAATIPPSVPFTASTEWTVVEIPLASFRTPNPSIIGGLAFVAQAPPVGEFRFELDDLEIIR